MTSMRSITTWSSSAQELFALARNYSEEPGTAFFYSGSSHDSAQRSFLALFPDKCIKATNFEQLEQELGAFDGEASNCPRFVGCIEYEMDRMLFYRPTVVVAFDHKSSIATLFAKKEIRLVPSQSKGGKCGPFNLVSCSDTKGSYLEKIAQVKEWILRGDVYQLNLSQQFVFEGSCDPFALFERLCEQNPSPFSLYMRTDKEAIVSLSPERLVKKEGAWLETRPIKGTAARDADGARDLANREELLASEKERAELLMITDLMRNDLNRVSQRGSVQVKKLIHLEAYTNVYHLLSIIESKAEAGVSEVSILRSLFPGGSITGCPKVAAMEKIADLEKRRRGIYTGSLGLFFENGDFDFNIAIRTLRICAGKVDLQLGGAITIDSDPQKEYEETLHKGRTFFDFFSRQQ